MTTAEELNDLREKVLAGIEIPVEDYAKLIQSYRAKRYGDVSAAAEKKASAKKTPAKEPKPQIELPDILSDII